MPQQRRLKKKNFTQISFPELEDRINKIKENIQLEHKIDALELCDQLLELCSSNAFEKFQILIWKDKHGDGLYAGNTLEQRRAALKMLFDAFENQQYFGELQDKEGVEILRECVKVIKDLKVKIDSGDLDDSPIVKATMEEKYKKEKHVIQRLARIEDELEMYKKAKEGSFKHMKWLLEIYGQGEYAGWEFEFLIDPLEEK